MDPPPPPPPDEGAPRPHRGVIQSVMLNDCFIDLVCQHLRTPYSNFMTTRTFRLLCMTCKTWRTFVRRYYHSAPMYRMLKTRDIMSMHEDNESNRRRIYEAIRDNIQYELEISIFYGTHHERNCEAGDHIVWTCEAIQALRPYVMKLTVKLENVHPSQEWINDRRLDETKMRVLLQTIRFVRPALKCLSLFTHVSNDDIRGIRSERLKYIGIHVYTPCRDEQETVCTREVVQEAFPNAGVSFCVIGN